jgi:cytochrome oxidase Cu insertion factor (SCO1/SenC/PrrC family)
MNKSILSLTLTAIGLVGCNQNSARPRPVAIAAGEIGSQLPEFSMKDLQGREISSQDLRGKVVLVDFWATGVSRAKKKCRATRNS